MPIKARLTVSEFNSLPDDSKSLYVMVDDEYRLDVTGGFLIDNDPQALLNAKNHEVEKRKSVEAELKTIKDKAASEIQKAKEEAENKAREEAIKNNDAAALHADLQKQIQAMQKKHSEELELQRAEVKRQQELVRQTKLNTAASEMASKISTSPSLLSPLIMNRLDLDSEGNIVATDNQGSINLDFDLSKLEQEFIDNKEYAPIIIGSKASGASGSTSSGSPVETKGKKWKDFSSEQLVQLRKENPAGYEELKATRE